MVSEPGRVWRASWKERDGRGDRSLVMLGIDQLIIYIKDNESGFSVSEKEDTNREREKIQVALLVLGWNWRYQWL